jgi:hypothetical protein
VQKAIPLITAIALALNMLCAIARNDEAPSPYGPAPTSNSCAGTNLSSMDSFYYRNQLKELFQYGPVFEVWFDGANGGDGYYGGAREIRRVDNRSYYEWPATWDLVRSLQPGALSFSDAGPDGFIIPLKMRK